MIVEFVMRSDGTAGSRVHGRDVLRPTQLFEPCVVSVGKALCATTYVDDTVRRRTIIRRLEDRGLEDDSRVGDRCQEFVRGVLAKREQFVEHLQVGVRVLGTLESGPPVSAAALSILDADVELATVSISDADIVFVSFAGLISLALTSAKCPSSSASSFAT